ncbi:hypothetical protein LOTGIDRAFT_161428 [Lottia gigantea]|uniref:Phytanoyl-CoA hydroxylase-interacting protein-like C-terminal domain-containing protein n=1 Tax=Lottia gigantea TaxID=225164 RepID=V4AGC4_LOTGI|nr:hypothetical protein LOTGIDRAFT_161428 [Lottia gigantea]ESO94220.1 hypothetical protein LOTGIDRAFT_161428 [Lottia gigantea]
MTLAENHLSRKGSSKATVRHLYRNKPTHHPTISKALETGIMEKYLKDNNGDPGLSINNKIDGLFFMATPKTTSGQIPDESFFGNYRIMIPPDYLVQGCNLYFADFTCLTGKSHYITLVLTKVNSKEDRYCRYRLVQLDFDDNPFFYKERGVFYVPLAHYLHVEILYTENVDLVELMMLSRHGSLDFRQYILQDHLVRGASRPGGKPKPSNCSVCNLSPFPEKHSIFL